MLCALQFKPLHCSRVYYSSPVTYSWLWKKELMRVNHFPKTVDVASITIDYIYNLCYNLCYNNTVM